MSSAAPCCVGQAVPDEPSEGIGNEGVWCVRARMKPLATCDVGRVLDVRHSLTYETSGPGCFSRPGLRWTDVACVSQHHACPQLPV